MQKLKITIGILIFFYMIINPQSVYEASLFAANTWWKSVLPSLLPFFILSEYLIYIGFAQTLSYFLEPIMKPLFKLSGNTALAVIIGFFSGTPSSSYITNNLYKNGQCSKNEAERLIAFTNNAGPLYILSAVSVGILHNPSVGFILFLSHYPVNFLLGIFLRFFAEKEYKRKSFIRQPSIKKNEINLSTGILLNTILIKSLKNISVIGGYMIVFSIITAAFDETGLTFLFSKILEPLTLMFGIEPECTKAIASGFWEMTLGVAMLSKTSTDTLSILLAASIILAWNGISIQQQVAAAVSESSLSLKKYRICRAIHSFIAPVIVLLLYKKNASVFAYLGTDASFFIINFTPMIIFLLSLGCIIILGAMALLLNKLKNIIGDGSYHELW